MTTILGMLNKVRSVDLREEVPRIVANTAPDAIKLNQQQLYNDSVDRNNEPLSLYRSLSYALEKNKRNPLPGFGRPDLYLTGGFFRGFVVKVDKNSLTINSTDYKTPILVKQYGDIFGLTEQSKTIYANTSIYQGIKAVITQKTGLVFR